jgi:hypothetical protein
VKAAFRKIDYEMPIYLLIGPAKKDPTARLSVSVDEDRAIRGTSTDPKHLNWIPLDSCQADKPVARSDFNARFNCTRGVDGISLDIFKLAGVSGDQGWAATIDFVRAGDSLLTVNLSSVIVFGYATRTGQGGSATETFTLDPEHVDIVSRASLPYGADGILGRPMPTGWDLGPN